MSWPARTVCGDSGGTQLLLVRGGGKGGLQREWLKSAGTQLLRKCGTQLLLVHLCNSLSVYNRPPHQALQIPCPDLGCCVHLKPLYAPYPEPIATVVFSTAKVDVFSCASGSLACQA